MLCYIPLSTGQRTPHETRRCTTVRTTSSSTKSFSNEIHSIPKNSFDSLLNSITIIALYQQFYYLNWSCIRSKIKLSIILTNSQFKLNWILTIRLLHSTSIEFFSIIFDLQVNWLWIDFQWFLFLHVLTGMLIDYHDK